MGGVDKLAKLLHITEGQNASWLRLVPRVGEHNNAILKESGVVETANTRLENLLILILYILGGRVRCSWRYLGIEQ